LSCRSSGFARRNGSSTHRVRSGQVLRVLCRPCARFLDAGQGYLCVPLLSGLGAPTALTIACFMLGGAIYGPFVALSVTLMQAKSPPQHLAVMLAARSAAAAHRLSGRHRDWRAAHHGAGPARHSGRLRTRHRGARRRRVRAASCSTPAPPSPSSSNATGPCAFLVVEIAQWTWREVARLTAGCGDRVCPFARGSSVLNATVTL
jgi:hypothetical protein